MKLGLADFVRTSVTCGRSVFELRTPSGDPLFVGPHHEGLADELRALAEQDAQTLSGRALVYTVWAKTEDGKSSSRYPMELAGGRETTGDALPDAHALSSPQAAWGHLVRLVIETNKSLRDLARDVAQARATEVTEQRSIVAKYARLVARHGEEALALKLLDIEQEKAKAKSDTLAELAKGAMPLALGIAARVGLLPAGPVAGAPAAANAVDAFLSSLSPAQGEKFFAILGPARSACVLRARGPNAARDLMTILLAETNADEQAALLALLTPEQVQALKGLMTAVETQVDQEDAKKAKSNGAGAHPGGGA